MSQQEPNFQNDIAKLRTTIQTHRNRIRRGQGAKSREMQEIEGTVLPIIDDLSVIVARFEDAAQGYLGYLHDQVARGADAPGGEDEEDAETQLLPEDAEKVLYVTTAAEHLAKKALEQGGMDAEGQAECAKIVASAAEVRQLIEESTLEFDDEGEEEDGGGGEGDEQVSAPGGSA